MSATCTAIYIAWTATTTLLREASFPLSSKSDDAVAVWFGDYDLPPEEDEQGGVGLSSERVVVAPFVDSPQQEWGPIGQQRRDEQFSIFVYVITAIPGQTTEEAAARLAEITDVVELLVHGVNQDRTSNDSLTAFLPFRPWWFDFAKVLPTVAPDPNGAIGKAEIEIRCKFRVGTPT